MISECTKKMIDYFAGDVKRINHALKVYGFAKTICELEAVTGNGGAVVELTGLLHDIGIKEAERKYNSSAAKYQEKEGPPVAKGILDEAGVEAAISERVCHIVGNHHSYDKIDGIDFQILVEADFIVNIFEGNMETGAIKSVKDKYFKTAAGKEILTSMYGV